MNKRQKRILLYFVLLLGATGVMGHYTGVLSFSAVEEAVTGYSVMSLQQVNIQSDVKEFKGGKGFLMTVAVTGASDDAILRLNQETINAYGLKEIEIGNATIKVALEEFLYEYPLEKAEYFSGEPVMMWKVYGSTASEGCLVNQIPYEKVDKTTTKKYAYGEWSDTSAFTSVPPILPVGIEEHIPSTKKQWDDVVEINELGYWMPEGHTYGGFGECTNENLKGDWGVTNFAGIPYAWIYDIGTSAQKRYRIRISIENANKEIISGVITEANKTVWLGDIMRVSMLGSLSGDRTPIDPTDEYKVMQYVNTVPNVTTKYGAVIAPDKMKFVGRDLADAYKENLRSLADLDDNFFTFTEEVKPISLEFSRQPPSGAIVGQDIKIQARVVESITRTPVPLAIVRFENSGGIMSSSTCVTGATGECSVIFTARSSGTYNILGDAWFFGMTSKAVMGVPVEQPVLAMSANPSQFTAGGSSTIRAELYGGVGGSISFSASGGSISPATTSLDNSGIATATFSSSQGGGYTISAVVVDRFGNVYRNSVSVSVTVPPPPRRIDPRMGADYISAKWGNLNTILASSVEDNRRLKPCDITGGSVSCGETRGVQYPVLQFLINAEWVGLKIKTGAPSITGIVSDVVFAGDKAILKVKGKNNGGVEDSFDFALTCPKEVHTTTWREKLKAGEEKEIRLEYSSIVPSRYDCQVSMRSTSSGITVVEPISLSIAYRPIPQEIRFLEKIPIRTDSASEKIYQTVKSFIMIVLLLILAMVAFFVYFLSKKWK